MGMAHAGSFHCDGEACGCRRRRLRCVVAYCYGGSSNFSLATLWAFRKVDFHQMPVASRFYLCLGPDNACEMTLRFKSTDNNLPMTHIPFSAQLNMGNSTCDAGYKSRIKCVGYSLGRAILSEEYHRPKGNPNPTRDLGVM